MSVTVQRGLPAIAELTDEGITVNVRNRDEKNDNAVRIAVLNLMPLKQQTESDIIRALSSSPASIDIEWIQPATHRSKNTDATHLDEFYSTFSDRPVTDFDGIIITGAPIERIPFESVDYWPELCNIMDSIKAAQIPTMMLCWGAFAGLYHRYGIPKYVITDKISGVFPHRLLLPDHPAVAGCEPSFSVPHSRFTEVRRTDVERIKDVVILAESPESGLYLMCSADGRELYVTGHSEYTALTLDSEYRRDMSRNMNPSIPAHYYPCDNPDLTPVIVWEQHRKCLFSNWTELCRNYRQQKQTTAKDYHSPEVEQ